MRVRLTQGRVGTDFVQDRGDIVTVPDDEGMRMCANQLAERVGPETASIMPGETAVRKRGRPRKIRS